MGLLSEIRESSGRLYIHLQTLVPLRILIKMRHVQVFRERRGQMEAAMMADRATTEVAEKANFGDAKPQSNFNAYAEHHR